MRYTAKKKYGTPVPHTTLNNHCPEAYTRIGAAAPTVLSKPIEKEIIVTCQLLDLNFIEAGAKDYILKTKIPTPFTDNRRMEGSKHTFTSPYHPSSTGLACTNNQIWN